MKPSLKPSLNLAPRRNLALHRGAIAQKGQSLAIALLLATSMVLSLELPAQANFLQTLRGIFTGDTGQGARGNARGASIRDRRCGTAVPSSNSGDPGAATATTSPATSPEQLTLLVPNTGQTLAATAPPEVFVYIPPHISGPAEQTPDTPPAPTLDQTKIDLDDIDSVVDEGLQEDVEQAQQSELLLEFQFDGTTRYYSLPDEALIAKLQAPESTAFEIGEVSSLEVRLVCRRVDLTSLSQTTAPESSYSTESEVFVNVQRVELSHTLATAMQTYGPDEIYQVYLDNGLWFEMVAALATNPQSEEWAALLQELEIPTVDPTPQALTPVTY